MRSLKKCSGEDMAYQLLITVVAAVLLQAIGAFSVVAPNTGCYALDNSSHIHDFSSWIGQPFEYEGKGKDADLVVRFCKDVESRSQAGYVDYGRFDKLNYFRAGSGLVSFVQEYFNGDLMNCEQSYDKMGRTAKVNIICGNCPHGQCKGGLGCICNVEYESACRTVVELAVPCEKPGLRVFEGFTVGFHPRSWEIVYNGLTQLGYEEACKEFSFNTAQTRVALYMTAIASVSGSVQKPLVKVSPEQGLKVRLSGSAATGGSPTTLSPTSLLIDWRCDVARDNPYEVEVTIPIENYDPVQFTLTKMCALLAFAPICFSFKSNNGYLYPQYYYKSCPQAQEIVKSVVAKAVAKEARMAASLLRLHFHDCFVKGCDASLLLDSRGSIVTEKRSNPNRNSARGFEVIDEIKSALEKECPQTVSCADILALAARDSTVLAGGPNWEVPLGRRDSRSASLSGSNNDIPAPNNTFNTILTKFKRQGLDLVDLVALSGSHTIGNSRCTSFRQRLYNQSGNSKPDSTLDQSYAAQLRNRCPKSGGDQNLFFLDFVSPTKFDNSYFKLLLASKGLLNSDQVLTTKNQESLALVKQYAENNALFFDHFAKSMVKMGNISPLTGSSGEIRKNCRKINSS